LIGVYLLAFDLVLYGRLLFMLQFCWLGELLEAWLCGPWYEWSSVWITEISIPLTVIKMKIWNL